MTHSIGGSGFVDGRSVDLDDIPHGHWETPESDEGMGVGE